MSKVYLLATGTKEFEWVDEPGNATVDAKESMEVTLKQLQGAKLECATKKNDVHEPRWIISSEA
jgi:hypothetical protein